MSATPELVEPQPTALSRRWLLGLGLSVCGLVARQVQAFERALNLGDYSGRHAGVASRRFKLLVSKQTRVIMHALLTH
jgi:hypothetical protein